MEYNKFMSNYVDLDDNWTNLEISSELRLKQVSDVLMYGILPKLSRTKNILFHTVKHPIPYRFHKFSEPTWICLIEDIVNDMREQLNLKPDYEYYDNEPWRKGDARWVVDTINNCLLPFMTLKPLTEYFIDCVTND